MAKFISCDWGTSALRLRIVDIDKMSVLAETLSTRGISGTFDWWKQSGKQENERLSFYQSILTEQIGKMGGEPEVSLSGLPLIISGMASSNIGMMELSYKEAPFNADGHDLYIKTIEATDDFKHRTLMISGAKTADDAMRGEETQLIGCLNDDDKEDQFFIFPGTHSKHIRVKNGEAVDVKTFMTGEFFELLSKKSILSSNVEESRDLFNAGNLKSFEQGVADSLHSNVLHSSFLVRTNHLFGKLSKQENYCYLSGLLIGTELKELINSRILLTIVSNELLEKLYSSALQKLGIRNIKYQDAGKAVIKGHCKIYNLFLPL
jgi:2-dehydro-3-deoxygalactonokinase